MDEEIAQLNKPFLDFIQAFKESNSAAIGSSGIRETGVRSPHIEAIFERSLEPSISIEAENSAATPPDDDPQLLFFKATETELIS